MLLFFRIVNGFFERPLFVFVPASTATASIHGVEVATVGQFRGTTGYVAQKLPSKLEMQYQVSVGEDRTSDPLMTFDG
ncbi:unnamed protein product [Litomosoides sigmodontis]|uniref:Uncharacterized protein n=1 Tax=Litomosoides sigmodontis TaxID=42156 RepID=A0A3P6TB20_LITSI|nr:unnamed protein product [Litomosoides sigmodontis]